jgi:hypothetical protein
VFIILTRTAVSPTWQVAFLLVQSHLHISVGSLAWKGAGIACEQETVIVVVSALLLQAQEPDVHQHAPRGGGESTAVPGVLPLVSTPLPWQRNLTQNCMASHAYVR